MIWLMYLTISAMAFGGPCGKGLLHDYNLFGTGTTEQVDVEPIIKMNGTLERDMGVTIRRR